MIKSFQISREDERKIYSTVSDETSSILKEGILCTPYLTKINSRELKCYIEKYTTTKMRKKLLFLGKWVMTTLDTDERSHKETFFTTEHEKFLCIRKNLLKFKGNQKVTKYLEQIYHTINIFII